MSSTSDPTPRDPAPPNPTPQHDAPPGQTEQTEVRKVAAEKANVASKPKAGPALPKSMGKSLLRVLTQAANPVYLVSTANTILFANPACAAWTETTGEELLACQLTYSSQAHPPKISSSLGATSDEASRLNGLCPPPIALAVNSSTETGTSVEPHERESIFVFAVSAGGQLDWRRAIVQPFGDDEHSLIGTLVICDAESAAPPDVKHRQEAQAATALHATLAAIRTRTDQIYGLESLVGVSNHSLRLKNQAAAAIQSDAALVIHGPLGSGKEHLGRTIHKERFRDGGSKLLTIHCSIADQSMIQEQLMEMLADQKASGRRVPESRTAGQAVQRRNFLLLLDVDQLEPACQVELLGFLQLPGFSAHLIATSATPLIELVHQTNFNQELAFRLSTMEIEIAPLAQRIEDVPLLAQCLLERDNDRRRKQLAGFSKRAMGQLVEFQWPENVDQLNRVIQAAARRALGHEITEDVLPDEFKLALSAQRIGQPVEVEIKLDDYLASIERELIARALQQSGGNKTKAAKMLGLNRPKLLRRIQFLGLNNGPDDDQIDASAFEELDP